jgi:hypothetical protein
LVGELNWRVRRILRANFAFLKFFRRGMRGTKTLVLLYHLGRGTDVTGLDGIDKTAVEFFVL